MTARAADRQERAQPQPGSRCAARWLRVRRPAPDPGFTLIEVVMSTVIIGIVMSSLITFFVATIAGTSRQFGIQTAAQLADDAIESVRAVRGSSILSGRPQADVEAQWSSPVADVQPYLGMTTAAWDAAPRADSDPVIPLTKPGIDRDGLTFTQHFYIGQCWALAGGGACTKDTARPRQFYRVIVAVTWSAKQCAANACSFVSSTLVATSDSDPLFNPNGTAQPASISPPGNQTGELTVPVDKQLTASGGAPPLTWSGTGLPAGVTIASDGHITGTPAAAGSNNALVSVTDAFGLVSTSAFTWTVNALPSLTTPANQTSAHGVAIAAFTVARTGGTGPLAWTQTGLPPGLTINASTGTVTGTPSTARPATAVAITVTDIYGQQSTANFAWAVT